jgi:aminopeptidase N
MAARSLDKRTDPETIAALSAALGKKSETWMVRSEAARALGKVRGRDAFRALADQHAVPHPKVRRAVVGALGQFRTDESARLLARAAKKDASYLVSADAARALGETRQPRARETLVSVLRDSSWADVKRAAALDGLSALRDEAAVPVVLERTRYGHSSPARRSAVAALAALSDDRKVRAHLEDLLDDPDPHFRMAVVRALETVGDGRARGALRNRLDSELDGRVMRRLREALRSLGDKGATDQKRVNDELEQLRRELTELKTRVSKVEHIHKSPPKKPRSRTS